MDWCGLRMGCVGREGFLKTLSAATAAAAFRARHDCLVASSPRHPHTAPRSPSSLLSTPCLSAPTRRVRGRRGWAAGCSLRCDMAVPSSPSCRPHTTSARPPPPRSQPLCPLAQAGGPPAGPLQRRRLGCLGQEVRRGRGRGHAAAQPSRAPLPRSRCIPSPALRLTVPHTTHPRYPQGHAAHSG